jgi:MFS family permease
MAGLTGAALLIHGYHLGADDAEIYIPAARKLLNPALYPFGTEFFMSHAHLSLYSPILAWTARLTHLSMDWAIFGWYVATLFAMLASCWLLASACFENARARWGAVLLIAAVLAMPATNTGLLLLDPNLTARSFSTPLTLFTLAFFLERKYALAAASAVVMALIHPQMVAYLIFLGLVTWLAGKSKSRLRERVPVLASFAGILPTGFRLAPAAGPYREALYSRDYYFLYNWAWYHWLGMLAPLAILAWLWKAPLRGTRPGLKRLSFAMIPFGLLSIGAALVFSCSHELDMFARTQPLRTFHLITIVFVLLLGGLLGEYAAKGRAWVLAAVCLPLAIGMFVVARQTYPYSPQVEIPAETSSNAWVNTMLWVRGNTPADAVFAVDSLYLNDPGTDLHGFRAVAARSALADYVKDGGVVALFPNLAPEWKQMTNATYGLDRFSRADFERLRQAYPQVSWAVVHGAAPAGMDCPYNQRGYAVCRLIPAAEMAAVR